MKRRGLSDEEVILKLRDERISPKEIKDALNQSQIKSAVSNMNTQDMEPSVMEVPAPSEEVEVSLPEPLPVQEYPPENYTPKTKEISEEVYAPQEEYYPAGQEQQYAPQGYPQQYQEAISTDTIIEIAEQVFSEKMKNIQKKTEEMNEFRTLAQTKIDNALERIKRIEAIIDKLQISILEKISSYGKNLGDIKKEMSMMQDSFGKVLNPLVDNLEKNKKIKSRLETKFEEEPDEESEENIIPKKVKRTRKTFSKNQ